MKTRFLRFVYSTFASIALVVCICGFTSSYAQGVVLVSSSQFGGGKVAPKYAQMQAKVQKILDDAVANGGQSAAQCCVYIDGELAVDAWAGSYKKGSERKIDGDSLFPIYSTEKPIFATAVNKAVELGKMRYDMKVGELWSEFACNGKENVTIYNVITHHSGLPTAPKGGTTDEQYCDWNYMVGQCANFKLEYKSGGKSKYQSRTYAWLLGEPLSRAMKMPVRDAIIQLALKPAGIENDFFFGIGDTELDRCVTVYDGKSKIEPMNKDVHRRACVPSSNAMASARAIAKFYLRLTGMDGLPPILKPETLKIATTPCVGEGESLTEKPKSGGWNPIWGCGYALSGKAPNYGDKFGQGGLGGSNGYADLKKKTVVGFTCATSSDAGPNSSIFGKISAVINK